MKNGMIECSVCHSKLVSPSTKSVSRAYDKHRIKVSSKQRVLNILLVGGDCVLVGFQPILVYTSKVDGKFLFSPISVNFLTEIAKVIFAVLMLVLQARRQKVGEKPLLSISTFIQAARSNVLLAVPALLYAINNYLKFIMQAKPETVDKVCQIVRKQLALPADREVCGESKFATLGADSLDTVEIVMGLEEEFGISVEEESAQSITTVQEAADMIEKLLEKKC